MPDDVALEKVQLAEMLGATVERVRPGKPEYRPIDCFAALTLTDILVRRHLSQYRGREAICREVSSHSSIDVVLALRPQPFIAEPSPLTSRRLCRLERGHKVSSEPRRCRGCGRQSIAIS